MMRRPGPWSVRCSPTLVTAEDGEAGLAAAERHRPQVIVLDVKMRRMDGYTALMHLQFLPRTRDIPGIMLTGQEGDVYRILSGSGGAWRT